MRKVWKRYEWFVVKEEQKQHNEIHVRDEKIECKALQILSIFKLWITFIIIIIWLLFIILTSETLADNQINKQKCNTIKNDSSLWNDQMCCSKDHQWWKPWPWYTLILLPLCWRGAVLEVLSNHMKKVLLGGSSKESSDCTVGENRGHGGWD